MTELLITRTYVVAPSDDELLENEANKTNSSKSATLRRVIREWSELRLSDRDNEILGALAELDGGSKGETLARILRTHLRAPARTLVDTPEPYCVEEG